MNARLDPDQLDSVLLELRPADDEIDSFAVLNRCIRCADVAIQPARVRHGAEHWTLLQLTMYQALLQPVKGHKS